MTSYPKDQELILNKKFRDLSQKYKKCIIIDDISGVNSTTEKLVSIQNIEQFCNTFNYSLKIYDKCFLLNKNYILKNEVFSTNYDEVTKLLRDIDWALQFTGSDFESARTAIELYRSLSPQKKQLYEAGIPISKISPLETQSIQKLATELDYSGIEYIRTLLKRLIQAKRESCYFTKKKLHGNIYTIYHIPTYYVNNFYYPYNRISYPIDIALSSFLYTSITGSNNIRRDDKDVYVNDLEEIKYLRKDPTDPDPLREISFKKNYAHSIESTCKIIKQKNPDINIHLSPKISWKPLFFAGFELVNPVIFLKYTSELYNFNFSNIGNDIYLSPFNSRIIVEPHRIPIEIRHIIPAPFQNYIETASKKGLLNNPVESPMFLTAMQDLRTIIEPLFNKTTTRIMRKDIPDGTLDLLAITGLLHCMPVIEKLVRVPVSPYLEHFNDAVVRLFHNPKEPGFSLQFQISYRDSRGKGEEMNRTFGLPEDISRLIR